MDFLQQSVQNRIIVLFIAAAVDLLIGDPHWLWHPVQGVGSLISFFEKILRRIFPGFSTFGRGRPRIPRGPPPTSLTFSIFSAISLFP